MPQQQLETGRTAERDTGVEDALGAERGDGGGDGVGEVGDRERRRAPGATRRARAGPTR